MLIPSVFVFDTIKVCHHLPITDRLTSLLTTTVTWSLGSQPSPLCSLGSHQLTWMEAPGNTMEVTISLPFLAHGMCLSKVIQEHTRTQVTEDIMSPVSMIPKAERSG